MWVCVCVCVRGGGGGGGGGGGLCVWQAHFASIDQKYHLLVWDEIYKGKSTIDGRVICRIWKGHGILL